MKRKKIILIIVMLFLIISITSTVFLMRKRDYSITYKKDGYNIREIYNKKLGVYYFSLEKDGKIYEVSSISKQFSKKRLINNVEFYKADDYSCILFNSNKLNISPSCFKGDIAISHFLVSDEGFDQVFNLDKPKVKKEKFDNLEINALLGKKIAIWDNYGYMFISEDKKKKVDFLNNETYYDELSFSNGRFVLVPDYDQKYSFINYYILDMKKGKISKWNLDEELSFNIYYLGTHDNKIYLIDRKNRKEFELNPKDKKIELKTSRDGYGIIWNKKWESISMVKLVNSDYYFINDTAHEFILKENKLYLRYFKGNNDILVTDKKVDKIVYSNLNEAYYLVGDKLYCYSSLYGEVLMITYSEWNFNKKNPIYIY